MAFFGWGDIAGTPFASGYSQIQDEGIPLAPATVIDFVGAGVTATNGVGKTVVTVGNPVRIFTQTVAGTPVTNTTAETDILGAGLGSLTVPPNGFSVGDSFTIVITGHISSRNNEDLEIFIRASGGALLDDTGLIRMPQTTNKNFSLTVHFNIRALGVAGVAKIATGGYFSYNKDASFAIEGVNFSTENNTTFDTTIANTLKVSAKWASANVQNSIYTDIATLYKTF